MLFPRKQRWERIRKTKMIVGVLFTALSCAGCIGMIIYKHNVAHIMTHL